MYSTQNVDSTSSMLIWSVHFFMHRMEFQISSTQIVWIAAQYIQTTEMYKGMLVLSANNVNAISYSHEANQR